MALTAQQATILDNLDRYIPAFKRAALNESNRIKLGTKLNYAIASADPAAVVTADAAGAAYGAEEETLINEMKVTLNAVVTLLVEIKTALNA